MEAVESSLQTSRALIAPLMRLAADTEERRRTKIDGARGADAAERSGELMMCASDADSAAEERRRARASNRAHRMSIGPETDVWGKVKHERFDLQELCEFDEETYDHFEVFCATRIQAAWRMHMCRTRYRHTRWAVVTIQRYWRVWGLVMRPKKQLLDRSARIIQRTWRSMMQRRTFAQIRDIIRFRGDGDPAFLLKVLAPNEADFADEASGVHIRFRLGGEHWPPIIYYKVFTHRNIADIGAFAPRDYNHEANVKREKKRLGVKEPEEGFRDPALYDNASRRRWYRRHENNGWRLLNEQAFGAMVLAKQRHEREVDEEASYHAMSADASTAARSMRRQREAQRSGGKGFFHPIRAERMAQRQMRARRRQFQWMKKIEEKVEQQRAQSIVAGGKDVRQTRCQDAMESGEDVTRDRARGGHDAEPSGQVEYYGDGHESDAEPRIDDDDEFLQNFMDEESDLLAWTSALDYEAYLTDWHSSATTISTETRRNTLGYESWLSIRRAQEKALEFEYSMQSQDSAYTMENRRGAGSIASVYTDAEANDEYR